MRWWAITCLAAAVLAGVSAAWAQEEPSAAALERQRLLDEVVRLIPEATVRKSLGEFVGLESRVLGYPGNLKAAERVIDRLEQLGFERIDFDPLDATSASRQIPDGTILVDEFEAPIALDEGATLTVGDFLEKPLRMYPLWPNLVRTSQLPRAGITGHLIYVGRGTYAELDGKKIRGAIALMDFNCEKHYIDVRDLGAQAIVFVEPEETDFTEASKKMLEIPVNIPRFWLKRADARRLVLRVLEDRLKTPLSSPTLVRREARKRGIDGEGRSDFDVMMLLFGKLSNGIDKDGVVSARATCRMPWRRIQGKNVYAIIYGTDEELRKDLIVVQGFYDSISMVPSLAPGAESTGGIVALLELAKVLKAHPPKRSVLLLATGSHFVSWEGIADWVLRHAPRGGTKVHEEGETPGEGSTILVVRVVSLVVTAIFVAVIVWSSLRMKRWRALAADDPQTERRVSGMGSLRFFMAVFLLPVALITLLSWLEKPFVYETPEPLPLEHDARIRFFFSLDLSSSSNKLGMFYRGSALADDLWDGKSHGPYMAQYAKRLMGFSDQQKTEEKTGIHVEDCVQPAGRVAGDFVPRRSFLLDGTVILRTGNPCVTFMTIEDLRQRIDTPLDDTQKGRVNFANLTGQVRTVCSLILHALNDRGFLEQTTGQLIRDRVKQLTTRVVEANYRESFVADTPVVDALVVYKQGWAGTVYSWAMNYAGVRGLRICMADERGIAVNRFFQAAGGTRNYPQRVYVSAYRLSADDGRVIYAADRGEQGTRNRPLQVTLSHPVKEHQLIAFACEPLDLYQLDNSRYLRAVGSGGFTAPVIFDVNDAAPQEYGYDLARDQNIRTGNTTNVGVVYVKKAPPGTRPNRIKFIMGSTVFGVEYLLTNTQEGGFEEDEAGEPRPKHPAGVAFPAVPDHTVTNSALTVARDMIRIDDWRVKRFEKYGVLKKYDPDPKAENEHLATTHHNAIQHLTAAEKAVGEHRYADSRKHLDKALGYEARAYPDVKGTANDTVKGFMFYCVLLLPFAFFCERLFFGFPDIRKQLFGFAGFFLLIFGLMALVHPVFRITEAPYVILLAFVILVLAVSVLVIIISKFNEQMAKMRRKAAKVHEADVGRLSATSAAVLLGISNMKKRKVRTTLTTLTLILLTFTVMSFTSVRTETVYNEIPQSHKAGYTGLLLRDRTWFAVESPALDQFRRHFEPAGRVIPRGWLMATGRSGTRNHNFILYGSSGAQADCQGLSGMMPEETHALGLDSLLVAGRWFETPDEMSVVLPSHVAFELLEFTKEQVEKGEAHVRVRGMDLRLVGVLDSARLERVRDLDDETYTPIDVSGKSEFGRSMKEGMFAQNIVEIAKLPHLSTESTAIVPYDICRRMGGRIASAAVTFDEGYDFEPLLKEFLGRVGMTIFMGKDGQAKAYSSIALTSPGKLGNLLVPILIAALIVLNTMMGSVHERAHEIGIYSSVGLAPVHVAALFLAESCVYAVMGAISGYLLGTVVGKVVSMLAIPGLTLNYSSLSAVFSTLVVMGTVILSTLYPAKMAANMSVPDVTRQWKFPPPEGDVWQFDFPFTVATRGVLGLFVFLDNYFDGYKEESIGSFYADNIRFTSVEDTYGSGYVVALDCWLAPFDLSVSQHVELRALPTEDEGITRIEMRITRKSGEFSNWLRLNRGFLTLMRKQFLIWRTVSPDVKEEYRLEGETRLKSTQGTVNV